MWFRSTFATADDGEAEIRILRAQVETAIARCTHGLSVDVDKRLLGIWVRYWRCVSFTAVELGQNAPEHGGPQ
jgi:hypothetical protein